MNLDPSEKLAAFAARLRARVDQGESKMPVKGRWKRWFLFFLTIGRMITPLPAVWRGRKVVRAIERQQQEAERERLDRIKRPDKYRI